MSHTIELKKVSKYYAGEDSVSMGFSRIDLNLDIGEFVAITGESGSGKSTLLNVISGLDTYEEGEMFVCGEDTTAYGTEDYEIYRKTYIGNIFQDFNLINSYTVYQNIEIVMLLSGKKKKDCRERVLELIDKVGLSSYRRTKVSRLSGGQKQRVAIARALAKDAPIIVADEPTGNLDSASAESVMETLSKVSKDKLVVIVTHNYEQAEPYVTRKLTMHDGKIIEDKKITKVVTTEQHSDKLYGSVTAIIDTSDDYLSYGDEAASGAADGTAAESGESDEAPIRESRVQRAARGGNRTVRNEAGRPKKMRKGTEIRLGLRNTFNLPAKFILLFIVYLFVSTAVLGQYATTKNSMNESSLLGSNPYFMNSSAERIIVKKNDESTFTDADFNAILNTPNIKGIIKNDMAIDNGISFTLKDYYVEGPVMPLEQISESDIAYGHMPTNDYEIVVKLDITSDIMINISEDGSEYIDKVINIQDITQMQTYEFDEKVKLAGIVVSEPDEESEYSLFGYSTIYAGEAISNELMVAMMASASSSEMNFGGITIESDGQRSVFTSSNVPQGKVFIFEDDTYYYKDEKAEGEDFGLKVKNRFFESEGSYKVDKIITDKNCKELVGIPKDEYDMYYSCVFLSREDYRALFDKGYFQISAFMDNEQDSDATLEALNAKGFSTLAIKDSLSDTTGGYESLISMLGYGRVLVLFIVLFFIAYGVIKLIMRSRNSYYSTLRILGATKKNTSNILRVELIIMMIIAYSVDLGAVLLVKFGFINKKMLTNLLQFLTPLDYGLLAVALLFMSVLIANRYSRSIFTRSAMKAFREEA